MRASGKHTMLKIYYPPLNYMINVSNVLQHNTLSEVREQKKNRSPGKKDGSFYISFSKVRNPGKGLLLIHFSKILIKKRNGFDAVIKLFERIIFIG